MDCRNNNRKTTCIEKTNAICVKYEGYLPEYSTLIDNCPTVEETTEELYENQDSILKNINLSELGNKCIDFIPFQSTNNLEVSEAFLGIENEICELKNTIENSQNHLNISDLNLECLINDPCNNIIDTQTKLLQAIITKCCLLEARIIQLENNN